LTVDRNRRNLELLERFLGAAGYRTCAAATLVELDAVLIAPDPIALVLVDLAGFDRGVWDRCEQLRVAGIPFVVLSPLQSAAIQQRSLAHGARGVLIKLVVVKELLGVIGSLVAPTPATTGGAVGVRAGRLARQRDVYA
jgi:DNA-binding response OmpR family regulator